jgi:hypothetical protein
LGQVRKSKRKGKKGETTSHYDADQGQGEKIEDQGRKSDSVERRGYKGENSELSGKRNSQDFADSQRKPRKEFHDTGKEENDR